MLTNRTPSPNPIRGNILTCFTSAVATYLSYYDINYIYAFGLQLYLATYFEEQDELKGSFIYLHHPLVESSPLLTLCLTRHWTPDEAEAQELLIQEWHKHKQVIITGDTYALPWHINYKKTHAIHWFVVDEIDLDRQEIHIRDPFEFIDVHGNQSAYMGRLPLSRLVELAKNYESPSHSYMMRDRHGLGTIEHIPFEAYKGYQWFQVTTKAEQSLVSQGHLIQALLQTYHAMIGTTQRADLIKHHWMTGLEAVAHLPTIFETHLNNLQLYEMRDDFWGIARHHLLFAHSLRITAQEINQPRLAELATWCDEALTTRWLAIPRLMLYNQSRLIQHHIPKDVLIQQVREIYPIEYMCMQRLGEILSDIEGVQPLEYPHSVHTEAHLVKIYEEVRDQSSQEFLREDGTARNPIEELIADVWEMILERKNISIYDNFFNIGGDSLKATQIASRLSLTFHVEISLLTLLDKPTIAELATDIEEILLAQMEDALPEAE